MCQVVVLVLFVSVGVFLLSNVVMIMIVLFLRCGIFLLCMGWCY